MEENQNSEPTDATDDGVEDSGNPSYEANAYARPRTKGEYRWNNNPLEDRYAGNE